MNNGIQGYPTRATKATGRFRKTIWLNSSNYTTTSTSFVDIDTINLPELPLILDTNDIVEMNFTSQMTHTTTGNVVKMDWAISRPRSPATSIATLFGGQAAAVFEGANNQVDGATSRTVQVYFTCTEAGLHTFKPQWKIVSGSALILQTGGNYATPLVHSVKNLGPEL